MRRPGGDDPTTTGWFLLPACARRLGKTEAALRGLVQRRQIPFYKKCGRLHFDRIEIDRWMRQQDRLPFDEPQDQQTESEGHDEHGITGAGDHVHRVRKYFRAAAAEKHRDPRRRS